MNHLLLLHVYRAQTIVLSGILDDFMNVVDVDVGLIVMLIALLFGLIVARSNTFGLHSSETITMSIGIV